MLCNTLFVIVHEPEMALEDSEAKLLSDSYAEFSKHHQVPGVSAKRISELNMAGALLTVFGTRGVAMFRKWTGSRKKPGQVVNIQQGQGTA